MTGKKNKKRKRSKSFSANHDAGEINTSTVPSNSKKKKSKKQRKHHGHSSPDDGDKNTQKITSDTLPSSMASSSSSSSVTTEGNNQHHDDVLLPMKFPSELPRPSDDFLRNETPYRTSFMAAMETSYEGFVVDPVVPGYDTVERQKQLEITLDQSMKEYFRTDVTQPFGLGTKLAKTYVTRCLVGQPGTTYRYLGLRMFAHPWLTPGTPCFEIQELGNTLSDRTKHHMGRLNKIRRRRGAPPTKGRAVFDICLINRMDDQTALDTLKDEPSIGRDKTSVSWHADSSLEHYSTISVYQLLVPHNNTNDSNLNNDCKQKVCDKSKSNHQQQKQSQTTHDPQYEWSVALRVAHHSEGPNASRRRGGMDMESTIVTETPPIACSLPSCSAYYLLDDFNHHHQHTVLFSPKRNAGEDKNHAPQNDNVLSKKSRPTTTDEKQQRGQSHNSATSPGIRYSCTFRLLRPSHNVTDMLDRCKAAIGNFHKKGVKLWRSEQLLLTELETEWLRQFYIQGRGHYDRLWSSWKDPIEQLLRYWSQLENRTSHTIDLLRNAAEGRCEGDTVKSTSSSQPPPPSSRAERKARDRRKKAHATLQDLMGRSSTATTSSSSLSIHGAMEVFYDPLAQLLDERATMRDLWAKREKDFVFREMSPDYRPLPIPFHFSGSNQSMASQDQPKLLGGLQECCGRSPLPGHPQELRDIAKALKALGRAYESGRAEHLPPKLGPKHVPEIHKTESKDTTGITSKASDSDQHAMPSEWPGWEQHAFGLEMQSPWAGALLTGNKSIETRAYDLPPGLLGRRITILESPSGNAGVSSMGNVIDLRMAHPPATIIGWCTFSSVKRYTNRNMFEADESAHKVSSNSGYGWKDGQTKIIYGWVVGEYSYSKVDAGSVRGPRNDYKSAFRRKRSLYQLEGLDRMVDTSGQAAAGGSDLKPRTKRNKNRGQREKNKPKKKRY